MKACVGQSNTSHPCSGAPQGNDKRGSLLRLRWEARGGKTTERNDDKLLGGGVVFELKQGGGGAAAAATRWGARCSITIQNVGNQNSMYAEVFDNCAHNTIIIMLLTTIIIASSHMFGCC